METSTNSISSQTGNDGDTSLKELITKLGKWWRYLLSKWILIATVGFLAGVLGLLYFFAEKPIYKAQLSFALEDDKPAGNLAGASGIASQFGIDLGGSGGGAFSGDNLMELMKSRRIVEKTLLTTVVINGKAQTLADYYINFNNLRTGWKKKTIA